MGKYAKLTSIFCVKANLVCLMIFCLQFQSASFISIKDAVQECQGPIFLKPQTEVQYTCQKGNKAKQPHMFSKHVVSSENGCVKVDQIPYSVWRYGGNALWKKAWNLIKQNPYIQSQSDYLFKVKSTCQECQGKNHKQLSKEKTCQGIFVQILNCGKKGEKKKSPCIYTAYPKLKFTDTTNESVQLDTPTPNDQM